MNKTVKVVFFTVVLFFTTVNSFGDGTRIITKSDVLMKLFNDLEKENEVLRIRVEKIAPTDYDSQNGKQTLVVDLERSKSFIKEGERLLTRIDYNIQRIIEKHRKATNIIADVLEIQINARIKLGEFRAKK